MSDSTRNAKRNAKNRVTGIAAAFGGAKDIFTANVNKNAGPEAAAMGASERNKKSAELNFGSRDRQNERESSGKTVSNDNRQNAKVSTIKKTRPSDGTEFESAQNPIVGNSPAFAGNVGITQNTPQNNNSTNNGINPQKKRPDEDAGFIPKPAPTNGNNVNNQNKNLSQNATGAQSENTKNIPNGVPRTQRGGAPVIQNPSAVDAETASTLPTSVAESLQNQALIRPKVDGEGDQNFQAGNERQFELNLQQTLAEEELLNQILEQVEAEENQTQVVQKPKVGFPWLLFIFCFFEWFGVLLFSLTATVLGIVLLPVGIAIETVLSAWKIGFGVFINFWMLAYEKKYLNKYNDVYSKAKNMARFIPTKKLARRSILGLQIIPLVGDLLPVNMITVYMTYRSVKKQMQ